MCWKPGSGQRREDHCSDDDLASSRRRRSKWPTTETSISKRQRISAPTFRDRCPNRWPVKDHISGAKPRRRRPASDAPLHDKDVFDMHVLAAPRRHRPNGP
jgi:hypothetical protein